MSRKASIDSALIVLQNMAISNILKTLAVEYTEGPNIEILASCDNRAKSVIVVNPNKLMIIAHLTDASTTYFMDMARARNTPALVIMPEEFEDLVELEVKIRTAVENATKNKHMDEFINNNKIFGDCSGSEVFKYYGQDEDENKLIAVVTCDYADVDNSYSDPTMLQIKTISFEFGHDIDLSDVLITMIGNMPATTSLVSIEPKPVKELLEAYLGLHLRSAGFRVVAKTSVGGLVLVVDPKYI